LEEKTRETPTMKRKNGKMRSVGVQPFHSACSRGQSRMSVSGTVNQDHGGDGDARNRSSEVRRVEGQEETADSVVSVDMTTGTAGIVCIGYTLSPRREEYNYLRRMRKTGVNPLIPARSCAWLRRMLVSYAQVETWLFGDRMENWFAVDHLDVERLLADWRLLCPGRMTLTARNVFGDLFLADESGRLFRLDVAVRKLTRVADSEAQFRDLAESYEKREDWFAEADEQAFAARGLKPEGTQCIGFSVPLVFAESGSPDTPYVADLYERVSFLGNLNQQISSLPDGAKVNIHVKRRPSDS
jgi:hypothetical protein